MTAKIGHLEEDLADANKSVAELERRNREANAKVKEMEDDINEAVASVTSREERLAEFRVKQKELEEQVSELTQKHREAEESTSQAHVKLRGLQEAHEQSSRSLQEHVASAGEREARAEALERRAIAAEESLQPLKQRVAALTEERERISGDLRESSDRAEISGRDLAAVREQLKRAQATLQDKERLLQEAQQKSDKQAEELFNKDVVLRESEARHAKVVQNTVKMERDLGVADDKIEQLEENLKRTRERATEQSYALAKVEAQLKEEQTASAAARAEIADLQSKWESARREAASNGSRVAAAEKTAHDKTVLAQLLSEERDDCNQRMLNLESELEQQTMRANEESKRRQLTREQLEQEREKVDRLQDEMDLLRKSQAETLARAAQEESTRDLGATRSRQELERVTEELRQSQDLVATLKRQAEQHAHEVKRAEGWEERERKWREALRLLGQKENDARRALSASEQVYSKRQADYESELQRSRTLRAEVGELRTALEERNALLAAHGASTEAAEAQRRKLTIQQLEQVVAAQKDEIRALEARLSPEDGATLSKMVAGSAGPVVSSATSHVFMEEASALQTKLTHERSWRAAVESEVKVLQRVVLALHATLQRQNILLQVRCSVR